MYCTILQRKHAEVGQVSDLKTDSKQSGNFYCFVASLLAFSVHLNNDEGLNSLAQLFSGFGLSNIRIMTDI